MATTTFKDLIESETPVLVDFHADWCGPCKMQSPILEELKNEMGETLTVVKIDVDQNQSLAQNLGVRGIPTLMLFQQGELKWQGTGVQTKQTLQEKIAAL